MLDLKGRFVENEGFTYVDRGFVYFLFRGWNVVVMEMDRAFGKKFSISQARMHAHNVVRILTAGGPAEMNRQCR